MELKHNRSCFSVQLQLQHILIAGMLKGLKEIIALYSTVHTLMSKGLE